MAAPPEPSVFAKAVAAMPACTGADGELLTVSFLEACRLIVPVIGARKIPAYADRMHCPMLAEQLYNIQVF